MNSHTPGTNGTNSPATPTGVVCSDLLADLLRAYEREVNPAYDWTETALTQDEFAYATKEYRAAKEWLSANSNEHPPQRQPA